MLGFARRELAKTISEYSFAIRLPRAGDSDRSFCSNQSGDAAI